MTINIKAHIRGMKIYNQFIKHELLFHIVCFSVKLVNLKELGNGTTCPVVRETKEARELNNKIRIVFKMSLSNISVL
jgi:hypothetical protein